ncbi:MAG: 3-deoxy-D-manno-octulosonic acid transferase [Rugosibacter sp.]|nr:3-deoxy-D-manno-octulosonic acid transferase [Rugosibacter sp.]
MAMTWWRVIYTLAVLALLPWAAIHLLWRARRQKEYLHHWGERWGFFPQRKPSQQNLSPTIWLHAVSVGETRAAQPLVAALRARYPDHRILFTHMTPTGRAASVALFGDTVERLYLPYDTPWAMRRFLCHYQPRIGLIMETELWPNLLTECRALGVPVYLLNARLSARSARRYGRWPNLTRQVLQSLSAIGAQSADDAARLTRLGAQKITVTGNMKFDIATPPEQMELGRMFRARMGARPVWLAASTREGEEALILDAWHSAMNSKKVLSSLLGSADEATALQGEGGQAKNAFLAVADGDTARNSQNKAVSPLLVIVPRHPQRFDEVAQRVTDRGLRLQRRSEGSAIAPTTHVLLGDSMGEMFAWYAAVDVAFIGGSLKDYGCQNLIEACAVGTPVLIGPSTYNFAEAAREALACGAAHAITDADDLVRQIDRLLTDVACREQMSQAGREFAARHRGATEHTLELISSSISSTVR